GFCAIGSVKASIGHLDTAAGIAGLIKTVLALKHKAIPPSLNFEKPNPRLDLDKSPFYVNTILSEWEGGLTPLPDSVSSFGVGGTNANVILEEAPPHKSSETHSPWRLLTLSAKTDAALEKATENLAEYLRFHQDSNIADVSYTLRTGRRSFNKRRIIV